MGRLREWIRSLFDDSDDASASDESDETDEHDENSKTFSITREYR